MYFPLTPAVRYTPGSSSKLLDKKVADLKVEQQLLEKELKTVQDELRQSLLQPVSEGACPFLTMASCCCLVGIVVPVVCFAILGGGEHTVAIYSGLFSALGVAALGGSIVAKRWLQPALGWAGTFRAFALMSLAAAAVLLTVPATAARDAS